MDLRRNGAVGGGALDPNLDDPFISDGEWIEAAGESYSKAMLPVSPTERQRRIAAATQAKAETRALANEKPLGGRVATSREFAWAIRQRPADPATRKRVIVNAIRRVKIRTDVKATDKDVFEEIAWTSNLELGHCFLLLDAIGFTIGIERKATIQTAIERLVELGLIVKFTDQGRVYTVPVFLPSDIDGSLAKKITETKRLIHESGIAFPASEAVRLAQSSEVCSPIPVTPEVTRTGLPLLGAQRPLEIREEDNRILLKDHGQRPTDVGGIVEFEKKEARQWEPGMTGSDPGIDRAGGQVADAEDGKWNPEIQAGAIEATQFINRKELRADFQRYVTVGGNTVARWRKGLRQADFKFLERVQSNLISREASQAFCKWERDRELKFLRVRGNSQKPLPENTLPASIGEFLASDSSAKFPVHRLALQSNGMVARLWTVLPGYFGNHLAAGLAGEEMVARAEELLKPEVARLERLAQVAGVPPDWAIPPDFLRSWQVDLVASEDREFADRVAVHFKIPEHRDEIRWFAKTLSSHAEKHKNGVILANVAQTLGSYRLRVDPDFALSENAVRIFGHKLIEQYQLHRHMSRGN